MNQPDLPSGDGLAREDTTLAGRYRKANQGRELRTGAAVALVAAASLAWLLWAALAAATPDVRSRILDFRVLDDHRVEATVEVVADRRSAVACTLRAQDGDHVTTGVTRVVIRPGSSARRVVRSVIETRDRGVVVTVVGCRPRAS